MKLTGSVVSFLLCFCISLYTYSQQVSVDIQQAVREIPSHAVGINMNYLMDGTYINSAAQNATSDALKNMGVKFLRYPGGEKSDNYLFSSPPYSSSNPKMALPGNCQWPSRNLNFIEGDFSTALDLVLDFDEYMEVCKQVNAEPMIVLAYDAAYYGTALNTPVNNPCGTKPTLAELITHAAEWVRYANVVKGYNIKYWCIGNESWGSCDYNGCVTPEQYAPDIIAYATAMRAVDPSIKIIVNGRGTHWWKTLLQSEAAAHIDYFGVSCYPIWNFTGGYEQYRSSSPNLLAEAQTAVDAINNYAASADKSRIKVISTEFNAIDFNNAWTNNNDLGHALVAFETMGQHLENSQVEAALLWNTRWTNNVTTPNQIYDALNSNSQFNANGLALSIWGNHLLPQLVKTSQSGSGNEYLRSYAVYDETYNKLNVFVINKDNISRTVDLNISNYTSLPFCIRYEFKGSGVTDTSPTFTRVTPMSEQVVGYPYTNTVSPNSITLFQFEGHIVLPGAFNSLRVELINNEKTEITWNSTGDHCGQIYTLQRSTDGINWQPIQAISDRCKSSDQYRYIDTDLKLNTGIKRIYYRIEAKDIQGKIYYSPVKNVIIPTGKDLAFYISPNPFTGIMLLQIDNVANGQGKINILSMDGKKLNSYLFSGITTIMQINLSHLPAGMYIVEMLSGNQKIVKKAFKQ